MRLSRILPILLVVCLGVSSVAAPNSDAALERFKKDMAALNAYSSKQDAELKAHPTPLAGILMLRTLIVGVKAVQTDGLPDDLKATFLDFVAVLNKFDELFSGWPDKPQDAQAFLRRRATEDPKFVADFTGKLDALLKQMEPVRLKLDEMSTKYGFDNMNGGATPVPK